MIRFMQTAWRLFSSPPYNITKKPGAGDAGLLLTTHFILPAGATRQADMQPPHNGCHLAMLTLCFLLT